MRFRAKQELCEWQGVLQGKMWWMFSVLAVSLASLCSASLGLQNITDIDPALLKLVPDTSHFSVLKKHLRNEVTVFDGVLLGDVSKSSPLWKLRNLRPPTIPELVEDFKNQVSSIHLIHRTGGKVHLNRANSRHDVGEAMLQNKTFVFSYEEATTPNVISPILDEIEITTGCPATGNLYGSTDPEHRFEKHEDTQDAFVVPLDGAKHFTTCDNTCEEKMPMHLRKNHNWSTQKPCEEECKTMLLDHRENKIRSLLLGQGVPHYAKTVLEVVPKGMWSTRSNLIEKLLFSLHTNTGAAATEIILEEKFYTETAHHLQQTFPILQCVRDDKPLKLPYRARLSSPVCQGLREHVRNFLHKILSSVVHFAMIKFVSPQPNHNRTVTEEALDLAEKCLGLPFEASEPNMDLACAAAELILSLQPRHIAAVLQELIAKLSMHLIQRKLRRSGASSPQDPETTDLVLYSPRVRRSAGADEGEGDYHVRGSDCHDCCYRCCAVCRVQTEHNSPACWGHGTAQRNLHYHNHGTCNNCGGHVGPWRCVLCHEGWAGQFCEHPVCPIGSVFQVHGDGGKCVGCESGTYTALPAALSNGDCLSCSLGTFQPLPGQTSCIECEAGRYTAREEAAADNSTAMVTVSAGASACLLCASGTFSSSAGSTTCEACQSGCFCPFNGTANQPCLAGFYCPPKADRPVPCPVGYFCPADRLEQPLPCPSCEVDSSGQSPNIGCGHKLDGVCVGMAVTEPNCEVRRCTTWYGGRNETVVVKVSQPICIEVDDSMCGTAEVLLLRQHEVQRNGGAGSVTVISAVSLSANDLVGRTELRIAFSVPHSITNPGSGYFIHVNFSNSVHPYQSGSLRSDSFIVFDFAELLAEEYHVASSGTPDVEKLRALCRPSGASLDHSSYEIRQLYSTRSCQCLQQVAAGLDCYGLGMKSVPSLSLAPVNAFSRAADLFNSVLAALREGLKMDMITQAVEDLRLSVGLSVKEQVQHVLSQLRHLKVEEVSRVLADQESQMDRQIKLQVQELRDDSRVLAQLVEQHAEQQGYFRSSLRTLRLATASMVSNAQAHVEAMTLAVRNAHKQCQDDNDDKQMTETVKGAVKIVFGLGLIYYGQTGGIGLIAEGVTGIAEQSDQDIIQQYQDPGNFVSETQFSEGRPGTGESDCYDSNHGFSMIEASQDCSAAALASVREIFDSKKNAFEDPMQVGFARKLAEFVDQVGNAVSTTTATGICGHAAALGQDLADARSQLALLHGFTTGAYQMSAMQQMLLVHGKLVMKGEMPYYHLMRMKTSLSQVRARSYLEELMATTDFGIDKSTDLQRMLTQLESAMKGVLELELEFWQYFSRFQTNERRLVSMQMEMKQLVRDHQLLRQTALADMFRPSNMGEVFAVRHALINRPLQRELNRELNALLRQLALALQYQCSIFDIWHDCGDQNSEICFTNMQARIANAYVACKARETERHPYTKLIAMDFSVTSSLVTETPKQGLRVCIPHLTKSGARPFLRAVSAALINYHSPEPNIPLLITRTGPAVLIDENGHERSFAVPTSSWSFAYEAASCRHIIDAIVDESLMMPPLGGCFTLSTHMQFGLANASYVRLVFDLKVFPQVDTGHWQDALSEFDVRDVTNFKAAFFGCSMSKPMECKLDAGNFYCAKDDFCMTSCSGCWDSTAHSSDAGNQCLVPEQPTTPVPSTPTEPLSEQSTEHQLSTSKESDSHDASNTSFKFPTFSAFSETSAEDSLELFTTPQPPLLCEGNGCGELQMPATGFKIKSVSFDNSCTTGLCWVVEMIYSLKHDSSTTNIVYLPKVKRTQDGEYAPSFVNTFDARNFPCNSMVYDPNAPTAAATACCMLDIVSHYHVALALRSWGSSHESELTFPSGTWNTASASSLLTASMGDFVEGEFASGIDVQVERHGVSTGLARAQLFISEGTVQQHASLYDRESGRMQLFVGMAQMTPTGSRVVDTTLSQVGITLSISNRWALVGHGLSERSFVSYFSLRVNQIVDQAGSVDARAVQIAVASLTLDRGLQPNENTDLVPASSVRFRRMSASSSTAWVQACDQNLPEAFDALLGQSCAPDLAMCVSQERISEADRFATFNIPLGLDYLDPASSDQLHVELVLSVFDDAGHPSSMLLSASLEFHGEGIITTWCSSGLTSDLLSVVESTLIVGTTSSELSQLQRTVLTGEALAAATVTMSAAESLPTARSFESGLLTLVLSGTDAFFTPRKGFSIQLDKVMTLHINGYAKKAEVMAALDSNAAAFHVTVDFKTGKGDLVPSGALRALCSESSAHSTMLNACTMRVDIDAGEATPSVYDLSAGRDGAAEFISGMMGDSGNPFAKTLGSGFWGLLEGAFGFNGRYKKGWWINTAFQWDRAGLSLSQYVVIAALISIDKGSGTRRLLVSSFDPAHDAHRLPSTLLDYGIELMSVAAAAKGVREALSSRWQVRIEITRDSVCGETNKAKTDAEQRLGRLLGTASKGVQSLLVVSAEVEARGVQCNTSHQQELRAAPRKAAESGAIVLDLVLLFTEPVPGQAVPFFNVDKFTSLPRVLSVKPVNMPASPDFFVGPANQAPVYNPSESTFILANDNVHRDSSGAGDGDKRRLVVGFVAGVTAVLCLAGCKLAFRAAAERLNTVMLRGRDTRHERRVTRGVKEWNPRWEA